MPTELALVFDYLQPLQEAIDEIAYNWRPADKPTACAAVSGGGDGDAAA